MSQRAYCDQPHPAADDEADRWCEMYHQPGVPDRCPSCCVPLTEPPTSDDCPIADEHGTA